MKRVHVTLGAALAATVATIALAATPPTSGPPSGGSPGWFLQGSFPDPGGNTIVAPGGKVTVPPRAGGGARGGRGGLAACTDDTAKFCAGQAGAAARSCLTQNAAMLSAGCKTALAAAPAPARGAATASASAIGPAPGCNHAAICDNRMTNGTGVRSRADLQRVEWKQTLGYKPTYPYDLPEGSGGLPSVALDSKGDLWAFKRSPEGTAQLYEFDPSHKLIRTVGDDVIGHQNKAHGMAIDAHDNVWICDAGQATIEEVSPDGKLLKTIGVRGHRGDWVEEKGQRLLWQPVMLAFAKNGDMYIAEGHANESPNDAGSDDPANQSGAARIIHLDKDGNYINQWYGNNPGQGRFDSSHGLAIDPRTGDVWIGDREQYRIVVYTADGKFLRTMQMRNLVCAIEFDPQGNPWMGSGQDGQWLKLTREGKVIGAVGGGMGIGPGQTTESSYFVFDKKGDIYNGDTSVGRITEWIAPKK